ncbi:MAG: tetratricopeptide repeat protein [Elusimicrobia bacterium]|nr:tetratricopeptide repeat protein [Elusimicrobiota bacterium]
MSLIRLGAVAGTAFLLATSWAAQGASTLDPSGVPAGTRSSAQGARQEALKLLEPYRENRVISNLLDWSARKEENRPAAPQERELLEAVQILERLSIENPTNDWFSGLLTVLYQRQGRAADAEKAFERLRTLRPRDPHIYQMLALVYEKQGKKEDALQAWRKLLELEAPEPLRRLAQKHIAHLQNVP